MNVNDTVRLSDGWLALQKHPTPREHAERGQVRGVEYAQAWGTWTLHRVKVETVEEPAGRWWPAAMWEVTQ